MAGTLIAIEVASTPGLPIGAATLPAAGLRILVAAALGLVAGGAVLALALRRADRAVGQAVELCATDDRRDVLRLEELPQQLATWRRQCEQDAVALRRLDAALHGLLAPLRAARLEAAGGSRPSETEGRVSAGARIAGIAAEESEDEALREVAAAIAALVEAGERQRQILDALLARVEDDLSAAGDPLEPGVAGLEDAVRRLDELVQAWPSLTPLASMRSLLEASLDRMRRARRAVQLVDRELSAVRRRIGGVRVVRLTTEDFVGNGEDPGAPATKPP